MESLLALAGTDLDRFIAAAEHAELTDDTVLFGPALPMSEGCTPSSTPGAPLSPLPEFFIVLALAYMEVGEVAMAEATLLRWKTQLASVARARTASQSTTANTSAPPPSTTPAVLEEAASLCAGLLAVSRQSLRHFYGVAFVALHKLALHELARVDLLTATLKGDGALTAATVTLGGRTGGMAAVARAADAALDALAARHVRAQAALFGGEGTDALVADAASQLSISSEALAARLDAHARRDEARTAVREATMAESVESCALVEAALRVSTLA